MLPVRDWGRQNMPGYVPEMDESDDKVMSAADAIGLSDVRCISHD